MLVVGVLAWAPATYPGYWKGLDGFVPVFNVVQSGPVAGVATSADLWRGTGNATFILAKPFLLFGASPTTAVRAVFVLCFLLGGLGMYAWLRPCYGDRTAGLAGIVYMFLPPVLATVYVRGSLSDAMILALLPMALAAAAAYGASNAPSVAGLLVISILWMWRTQAGLAALATLLLLIYALVAERHRLTALVVAVSGAAGLASLVPIWSVRAPSPIHFDEHFVAFFQLFANGWATAPSIAGWQDRFPFQLGLVAVMLTALAAWQYLMQRRHGQPAAMPARPFWFACASVTLLVLAALAPAQWLWAVTGAERLFTYPWQAMLPAMPFLALSAATVSQFNPEFQRLPYWVALLVVTVLGSYTYLRADFTGFNAPARPVALFGSENNIAVLTAELAEDPHAATATLQLAWQTLHTLPADYNVFFQAVRHQDSEVTILAQIDSQPLAAGLPASLWRPGEIMQESYTLTLPPDTVGSPPLTYYFGFYDWRDGTRLPVDGGIDDKLVFYGR